MLGGNCSMVSRLIFDTISLNGSFLGNANMLFSVF